MEWLDGNRVKVTPPEKCKKVTGTKFATILGLNPCSTEFEMWCAITKTYEKPFEDTIYTVAGKVIEPKQAEYMENSYGMDIIRPTDVYGEDYFSKTYGDFFPRQKHLGGMWDYLLKGEDGKVEAVLEMKTTKRVEDWVNDIPDYYALQAALYAYLYGVEQVIMVASFLEDTDYDKLDQYVPNINNTITVEFKVSERYPDFANIVAQVEQWWTDHVDTGISPVFDETKDAEILKALRTNSVSTTDIQDVINEAETLKAEIDDVERQISAKERKLKVLNDTIKEYALSKFREGDKKVEIKGGTYVWTVSKTETTGIDKDALTADGLLEKYSKKTESYRMVCK